MFQSLRLKITKITNYLLQQGSFFDTCLII